MSPRSIARTANALTLTAGLALLVSCGGNKPAEQAAAPAAEAPAAAAPAAAPADTPAAPPAETAAASPQETTQTAPPPKPAPKPAPKPPAQETAAQTPKSEPPPKPAPVEKTLAAGTEIDVEMIDAASSKTSKVGDVVKAKVTQPVVVDGLTVIPAGAIVTGTVTEAVALHKIGGQASLGLRFDSVEIAGGGSAPIVAALVNKGKSETGKDAGTIAGATAGGALLGRLLSKNSKTKGTLIGAAVGAAAGTGIAAGTKGQEVEIPAGTPLALQLAEPAQATVQP